MVFVPFVPVDVLQLKTFCYFNKYHVIDNQTIGICRQMLIWDLTFAF